jgi:soluble lytic murein transglycosylase
LYRLQGVLPKKSEGYAVIQAGLQPRVFPSFQYVGSANYRSPDQDWQALESALFDVGKKDHASAMTKLEQFLKDFPNSGQRARARYWLARLYLEAKRPEAKDLLDALTRESPFSLYGIQAAFLKNTKPEQILHSRVEQSISMKDPFLEPEDQWNLKRALSLVAEGVPSLANPILRDLKIRSGYSSSFLFGLAWIAQESRSYLKSFQAMNEFLSRDPGKPIARDWLQLLYPTEWLKTIQAETSKGVAPIITLSLMKQESGFLDQAYSSAGALGLMQLMPGTAVEMDPSISGKTLMSAKPNIRLGTQYLAQMIERFSGNIAHALAAYNAGPGAVERWLRERPSHDMMLFIDLIPYKETREYVAAILRNIYWYTLKVESRSLDHFESYYTLVAPTALVTPQNESDTHPRPE